MKRGQFFSSIEDCLSRGRNSINRRLTTWIQLRDANTRFFHYSLKVENARNKIFTLPDGETSGQERIKEAIFDFYKGLMGTNVGERLHALTKVITWGLVIREEEPPNLCQMVTAEKIKKVVWSIGNEKSPGIDGFNSFFFKKTWNIIGRDVIGAIKEFFGSGKLLKQFNLTTLTMIPKVQHR